MPTLLETPALTRVQLEERRIEAALDFARGHSQADVRRRLHVSRTSVSRWYRQWQRGGVPGLARTFTKGRPVKLRHELLAALYRTGMTCREFREVVYRQYGVQYDPDHLNRLILKLRLRPRRIRRQR